MRDEPLVSVVTPVFNGAEYLEEAIESVLAQTYRNWEYTIVDNASRDATPEIAERYARSESRIRHLRFEEFVSATENHNRAFAAVSADSEFCKPLQADDWLYPECLTLMVEAAALSDNIGIVSAYQLRDRRVDLAGLPYTTTFATGRDIIRGTLLGRFNVTGAPTATLLRTRFVREQDPFWEEGFRHEDTEALLRMLTRRDFVFVHQILTFAREQQGSRYRWSENMNSQGTEDIVFLLRYGQRQIGGIPVLSQDEYRARLRERLRSYVWWHIRQLPRISRLHDGSFFEFHRAKRSQILAEVKDDPEVVAAMAVVNALLAREGLGRRYRPSASF